MNFEGEKIKKINFWAVFAIIFISLQLWGVGKANGYGRPEVEPGTILIKFNTKAGKLDIQRRSTSVGITSLDRKIQEFSVTSIEKRFKHKPIPKGSGLPDISRIYKLTFPNTLDPFEVALSFATDPNIEYAEPIFIVYPAEIPNDPLYSQQHHLPQIYAPEAWNINKGDSAVVIAIIDTGTDWEHPDMIDNVWTNELEANGTPGIDDDVNGYVDDIHGYDLGDDDNNPTCAPSGDGFAHGTLTAGAAAAVTNNGIGVAGVSWNCEFMPVKVSPDASPGSMPKALDGVVYAADLGADVISLSWSVYYSRTLQDIINYAYGMYTQREGAVVVASAGNTPNDDFHYPASMENVLSVTWVNKNDRKANPASWNIAVDIAAPGVDILCPSPFNDYRRASGSSLAAPVVAGVCAMVKSLHPDWSNDRIVRQVVLTADNIDALNPGYGGLLGSGRLNAYSALTKTELEEVPPRLAVFEYSIKESPMADGDGLYERGETIFIKNAVFRNYSLGAGSNVTFTLSMDDPELKIVDGSVFFGDIPADTTVTLSQPLSFSINSDAVPHIAELEIGWSADGGYSGANVIPVIIGEMPILVVDDDNGNRNVEGFYTAILDEMDVTYAIWDHVDLDTPTGEFLLNFPIIIWLCECNFPTLESDDRWALKTYLNHGGNLFISGQDIAWHLVDHSGEATDSEKAFFRQYLHADYISDDSNDQNVIGVIDDPISDGLEFSIWQPGLSSNSQYPDVIIPLGEANAVLEYAGGSVGGIKFSGDHKVIYFGFGFEAIDATEESLPTEFSAIRTELMARILNWLDSIMMHTPITDTEDITTPHTATARITGDISDLIGVSLYWRKVGAPDFSQVDMDSSGEGQYQGQIPSAQDTMTIEYYVELENPYFKWRSPALAPAFLHSFHVGPDIEAPGISHRPMTSTINGEQPFYMLISVTDNIELDTSSVYVRYHTDSIADSVQLNPVDSGPQFEGLIPPVVAYGDTLYYYFTAKDVTNIPNTGISETYQLVVGLEDFESGLAHWRVSPPGWGLETKFAHSGQFSINDSPGQTYPLNKTTAIATNFGLDLSQSQHAALYFWTKYFLEKDHDYGYIEVSTNGGTNWNQLGEAVNGVTFQWKEISRSLTPYCGAGFTDVRIRFRMVSDSHQGPSFQGWFVDDMRVVEGAEVSIETAESSDNLPTSFSLSQNYPNPFNPGTEISYQLPQAGQVVLKVFNLLGQEIRTLVDENKGTGRYKVYWNSKDKSGYDVASGIYFYRIEVSGNAQFIDVKKLVLIR